MQEILELSDRKFKITMINMVKSLTEKGNSMQNWRHGYVKRDIEILKEKNKMKCWK
jgi:hypothetical protein